MSKRLASFGLRTSHDFANIMGALFTDVVLGSISPDVCNAACNAGGKLLQVVALQHKYGSRGPNGMKMLMLADGNETVLKSAGRKAPSSGAKTRARSRAA